MGRKADPARIEAAVKAGDPPDSADYSDDREWHDAQDEWIADFEHTPWHPPGDRRRRDSWKAATKQYWRIKPAPRLLALSPAKRGLTLQRIPRQTQSAPQLGKSRVHAGPPNLILPIPKTGEPQEKYERAMDECEFKLDARMQHLVNAAAAVMRGEASPPRARATPFEPPRVALATGATLPSRECHLDVPRIGVEVPELN